MTALDRSDSCRSVLNRLAAADAPISGPELAAELDVSRAAVWKHVEALRDGGFDVASTDDGYRLDGVPEYGGAAVECGLDAPFRVEYHDRIGSTNARARELATTGETDVVVLADEQTGGRGRLDRDWASPPGGIWMSVACRPDWPAAEAPLLTLAAAVAVTRAALAVDVDAGIKWPNDVLVPTTAGASGGGSGSPDERKLAGVLTEMEGETDRIAWAVVGMGVNANVTAADLPADATSLRAERDEPIDRRSVTQHVLETFAELLDDPDAILPAWREHALTLGRRVRVETPRGTVVGEAVDVERPGTLVIDRDDGTTTRVRAGDCDHLRPAGA